MAFDLTTLVGFNFSGLEVDQVAIDTAADDVQAGNPPQSTDYVPGSTTYTVLGGASGNTGFSGNDADPGTGTASESNVIETIENSPDPSTGNPRPAATNGTTLDGTTLGQVDPATGQVTNPLALGQIAVTVSKNGSVQSPVTYDVLGYSADGSTILVGLAPSYNAGSPTDPYGGQYYLLSDGNVDGNATPSLFPNSNIVFTAASGYTGGPVSSGGVAGDLVTVSNALVGTKINGVTGLQLTYTQNGSAGVTFNTDGSITVTTTSNKIGLPAGTLIIPKNSAGVDTAGYGVEGQPTLEYNNSTSAEYFQVIGFNAKQILLLQVTSNGTSTSGPSYAVLSLPSNAPAQNAAVNLTFNDFGLQPTAAYCFLGGTRIATPDGERDIETLAIGDLVLTSDGSSQPVRWLGRSTISTVFADPVRSLPVRIRAGALGENLPTRDLLVSSDHAMFIGGFLVHAGALVNGTSIVRELNMPPMFIYYHLELEQHALIFAEGALAETFVDNVDRMEFDNWDEHPDVVGDEMVELPYARAKSARQVPAAVRQLIAARAAVLDRKVSLAA